MPGTDAYNKRTQDAVPDEVGIVGDVPSRPTTPGGLDIPITVVEKVDPAWPSKGDIPGTPAYAKRELDSVPDMIYKASETGISSRDISPTRSRSSSTPGDLPIPITKVSKIDDKPSYGEVPGNIAYEKRQEDAKPDIVESSKGTGRA